MADFQVSGVMPHYVDPTVEHVGVSKLRQLNATNLGKLKNMLVVQDNDTALAVVIRYVGRSGQERHHSESPAIFRLGFFLVLLSDSIMAMQFIKILATISVVVLSQIALLIATTAIYDWATFQPLPPTYQVPAPPVRLLDSPMPLCFSPYIG